MHNTEHLQSLVGSAEAAQMCGVDRATFNRWAADGEIEPVVAMPGKRGARLYAREAVEALATRKGAAA